jgi:PAS domain S-box-containing protein
MANLFKFPLFFGVDFLFASVFVFIAIHHIGMRAGIIVALLPSIYTIFLWGHNYAFILYLSEAIVVGYLYKRLKNLIIASSFFWFFIGPSLIYFFYQDVMGLDTLTWQLIMVKQIFNGVLNTIIAILLINFFHISSPNNRTTKSKLEESIIWFTTGIVIVPLLIIMELEGINAYSKMNKEGAKLINHIYDVELKLISQNVEDEILRKRSILVELAQNKNIMTFFENKKNHIFNDSITSLLNVFDRVVLVTKDGSVAGAYVPSRDSFDDNILWEDLSFQQYFKDLFNKNKAYVSNSYIGNKNKNIISVNAPIIGKGQNKYKLIGVFRKEYLSSILNKRIDHIEPFIIELNDEKSNVITSNHSNLHNLRDLSIEWSNIILEDDTDIIHFIIKNKSVPLMTRWSTSYFKKERVVSDTIPWKVSVLFPLKDHIDELRKTYTLIILVAMGLVFLSIMIAHFFSRAIVKPFIELTKTVGMIDDNNLDKDIVWPQSKIYEASILIDTLKSNRQVIANTFSALTKKNIENETITKSLKVSQQSLDSILANVNECIITCNDEGIIKSANKSTHWVFGYEYGTLIGKHIYLLITEDFSESNGETVPLYLNSDIPLFDKLSTSDFGRYANGGLFPIEISMTETDNTKDKLLIAVIRDISAKLEIEAMRKASSHRIKMFFSVASEGIFFYENGLILDVNESGAQMLGYDIQELIGKNINELTLFDADFLYLSDSKNTWEADAICKDGTSLAVEVKTGNKYFNGTRYISFKNVKYRKKIESEIAQKVLDLTILIDTANAPIFGIDIHGNINEWNLKSAEITGFKAEEVLGKNLVNKFITEDYRESVNEVLHKALKGNETSNFEFPLYTKNKSLVMVLLNAATRRNSMGDIIGVVGVGQDITELDSYRSEMERKVNDRTRELDSIFILSSDGIVLANSENNISYINPAFSTMTSLSESDVLGKSGQFFTQLMSKLLNPKYLDDMKGNTCIGGGNCDQLVYLLRPKKCILECSIRTMFDAEGGKKGQVLYFRDVTHSTEIDNMKSEFLSTAAHELRTPLASIYGFSELLLTRDYDEKMSGEMIEMIETIHRQSLNLKHLLDELLDLSRIEERAGKDFYMMDNSLETLVIQSSSEAEGAFLGREIEIQSSGYWPILSFDVDKIRQVFNNLISNGFKYSPDNEKVILKTIEREKNGVMQFGVSIIDKGIGMTPYQLSRLGERFYRADDSGAIAGTGLGVSLVKEIMSIHGGEAEFISTKGHGMSATIWLPIILNKYTEE